MLAVVLQIEKSTYEAKTQEIAKQLLAATQENRSFLASLRDQMRWEVTQGQHPTRDRCDARNQPGAYSRMFYNFAVFKSEGEWTCIWDLTVDKANPLFTW